jgi:hypothetical protein
LEDSPGVQLEHVSAVDLSPLCAPGDACFGELQSAGPLRCNVMLEGGTEATVAIVALLEPYLRGPIVRTRPGAFELELPPTGTVVLEAVSELDGDDQSRMMRWLDDTNGCVQTISITTMPLFPLVVRGLFTEALYYRLNSILLRVRGNPLRSSPGRVHP